MRSGQGLRIRKTGMEDKSVPNRSSQGAGVMAGRTADNQHSRNNVQCSVAEAEWVGSRARRACFALIMKGFEQSARECSVSSFKRLLGSELK